MLKATRHEPPARDEPQWSTWLMAKRSGIGQRRRGRI